MNTSAQKLLYHHHQFNNGKLNTEQYIRKNLETVFGHYIDELAEDTGNPHAKTALKIASVAKSEISAALNGGIKGSFESGGSGSLSKFVSDMYTGVLELEQGRVENLKDALNQMKNYF